MLYYLKRDLLLKQSIKDFELPPLILRTSLKRGIPNKETLLDAAFFLELVSGQKVVGCRAKKSSAHFKIRQGDIIGWKVTLRGTKASYFLSKWTNYVLATEDDVYKVRNLSSFLELSEAGISLPSNLALHVSFHAKDPKLSNLLLSGLNIPYRNN